MTRHTHIQPQTRLLVQVAAVGTDIPDITDAVVLKGLDLLESYDVGSITVIVLEVLLCRWCWVQQKTVDSIFSVCSPSQRSCSMYRTPVINARHA